MKTTLTAMLTLALLSQCRTAERISTDPDHQTENPANLKHTEAGNYKRESVYKATPATPPPVPVKPTRREYKAYKRQLDAWEASQKAYAKAASGPEKVKVKGTGATASVATAAPGGVAVAEATPTTTDNTKAGQRGGAAATAPGAVATATTERPGFPWVPVAIGAVLIIGGGLYVFRKSIPFFS